MQKKYFQLLTIILLLIYFIPDSPKASEDDLNSRDKVFQFLNSAFQTQVSLSELDRSMEEIKTLMEPYFSKEYQQKFLDVNLHEENGKYFTYGTDFGELYIPFFEFSDITKVVFDTDAEKIYVFEYFPKSKEGPITYDNHYQGILIKKIENQWKISEYLYNQIPQKIIYQALEQH